MRQLLVARDAERLADMMVAPVVMVSTDDVLDNVDELFARYRFRMLPVVDASDRIVGVVHGDDVRKGISARARD